MYNLSGDGYGVLAYNSEMPKARCPRNQLGNPASQLLLLGIVRSLAGFAAEASKQLWRKNKQTLHKCGSASRGPCTIARIITLNNRQVQIFNVTLRDSRSKALRLIPSHLA